MKLEGRIWKSSTSRYWLAEVRDLDLVTQGTSRRDAAHMVVDAVESLVDRPGFRVQVEADRAGHCTVGSNDDAVLVAFMLRALRAREGLSVSRLVAALNPSFQPILRVA